MQFEKFAVEIVPYDSAWPAVFRSEAARIAPAFGGSLLAIEHVGSTAVPGLAAKPIVDMMPLIRSIAEVDEVNTGMTALGYVAKGEYGLAGRRYFVREENGVRLIHVHAFEADNGDAIRMLDFRDYLRAHPADAEAYAALKRALAAKYPDDSLTYNEAKTDFIRGIEAKARAWRESGRARLLPSREMERANDGNP